MMTDEQVCNRLRELHQEAAALPIGSFDRLTAILGEANEVLKQRTPARLSAMGSLEAAPPVREPLTFESLQRGTTLLSAAALEERVADMEKFLSDFGYAPPAVKAFKIAGE